MRRGTSGISSASQTGFTYVVLLVAVVVVGILAEGAQQLMSRVVAADREAELIFRGRAYRAAIGSYYLAGEPNKIFPRNLEDLVSDPRFAHKRHIRRLYADPTTGGEWQLVRAPDGGISGVVSANDATALKQGNFPVDLESFQGTVHYSEWVFEYIPEPERDVVETPIAR